MHIQTKHMKILRIKCPELQKLSIRVYVILKHYFTLHKILHILHHFINEINLWSYFTYWSLTQRKTNEKQKILKHNKDTQKCILTLRQLLI